MQLINVWKDGQIDWVDELDGWTQGNKSKIMEGPEGQAKKSRFHSLDLGDGSIESF